jgi:hypothetical protein
MLELAMASGGPDVPPAVLFDEPNDFPNLHAGN